jgi:hypothetical protein
LAHLPLPVLPASNTALQTLQYRSLRHAAMTGAMTRGAMVPCTADVFSARGFYNWP